MANSAAWHSWTRTELSLTVTDWNASQFHPRFQVLLPFIEILAVKLNTTSPKGLFIVTGQKMSSAGNNWFFDTVANKCGWLYGDLIIVFRLQFILCWWPWKFNLLIITQFPWINWSQFDQCLATDCSPGYFHGSNLIETYRITHFKTNATTDKTVSVCQWNKLLKRGAQYSSGGL